jgi:hypothetical protein
MGIEFADESFGSGAPNIVGEADSRPMTLIDAEKLDRMHIQIRASNSLTAQLRSLTRNLTAPRHEIIKRLELILDKYRRAIAPKPPPPTSAQVLAAFEQTRKLYDAWVSSLVYESRYPQAAHDSGVVQIWEQTTRICDRCVSWTPEK